MNYLNKLVAGAIAMIAFTVSPGCSNEEQLSLDGTADATTPLSISVSNSLETKVGGVVSGSQFGDGASLGLFLTKEDGSSPYDEPYNNIQYTSSNSGQTWTATSPILLTGTKANVYAYYPYDVANTNITAIPINVTENKDIMWADYASNINNANPTATLPMNHALSVIRFSLSKGDYSGAGNITSICIKGAGMAKTGTLNAKTGAVTPTDGGTEIDLGDLGAAATLTGVAQTVEQLVIPTTSSGNISVTIQMDGTTFEATSSASITPERSKAYKFGLAFSDSKLTMSTVTIGTISEVDEGNMTPIVANKKENGVYAIKSDGTLVAYADATDASYAGVAIVMYGRALQISNSELTNELWGDKTVNISGIPEVTQTGGGVTGRTGYLPKPDGSYATTEASYQINADHTTWRNTPNTALADTCGWSHTEALITTQDSSYLGGATQTFRENSSVNQGYSDWFVPASGQLAYMYPKMKEINTLLAKCSNPAGTALTNYVHWSSSEYNTYYAWTVYFYVGCVDIFSKNDNHVGHVRFCRYITE